jgi:hypothetical protein
MISTITSLFSLARNMSLIIINPFLDLEAQTNNKRRGYNTQGIGEDLLELIDTYIELAERAAREKPETTRSALDLKHYAIPEDHDGAKTFAATMAWGVLWLMFITAPVWLMLAAPCAT